ncbi:MAG: glutamate--tRNA ligase [Deltaproteobacteria bacterium]|nr:glutamate--tRNA ligase [Deltaproteobacteria bacterium]
MEPIVTRFPPSPTGNLHVGGARTALFNWLYARRHGGKFILRMEDTDRERSKQEYVDAILDALTWLGIDWDEGPHFQSRRGPIYAEYIQRLLDTGNAYYCTCPPEVLERKRKAALEKGQNPVYDGTCREKSLAPREGAVVRLKSPKTGATVFEDRVKGPISTPNSQLDDLIIARSDGSPTYHLAVVVDDITMGVTHIIRGDDHVSNTPRQIAIYKALGVEPPVYAHVPMVLGPDKKRLSKRHGAASVTEYREMGYLPEAIVNFLARLGWSHGDQEFFTVDELEEKFSLENIGKSAGVFDPARLLDLNADHMRAADTSRLAGLLIPHLEKRGVTVEDRARLKDAVETLKPRAKTLEDMAESALFYFTPIARYEEKGDKKFLKAEFLPALELLSAELEDVDVANQEAVEAAFGAVMEQTGLGFGKIAQPVRVAITGKTASPGMFETMRVLGNENVKSRLKNAIAYIKAKEQG